MNLRILNFISFIRFTFQGKQVCSLHLIVIKGIIIIVALEERQELSRKNHCKDTGKVDMTIN